MSRKIILLCAGGMSTGMLVKKMEKYASEIGYDCTIAAYGKEMAKKVASDADIVLLGPQIKFAYDEVKKEIPEVPIEIMGMKEYGMQKADVFVEKCREVLGDK